MVKSSKQISELEKEIKNTFSLRLVKIVKYENNYEILKKRLGASASEIFEEYIKCNNKTLNIGIGGGSTIHQMIDCLEVKPRNINIFPMALIGRGPEIEYVDSSYLTTSLFYKSKPAAKAFIIGIPPLPSTKNKALCFSKYLIDEIPEIKWVLNKSKNVDMAFIGSGGFLPMGDWTEELSKLDINVQYLLDKGVVGGINYNWFDGNGNQIGNFFLNISINDLKGMASDHNKLVVLVAGGPHKYESIRVAISKNMVNSLITDDINSYKLLSNK